MAVAYHINTCSNSNINECCNFAVSELSHVIRYHLSTLLLIDDLVSEHNRLAGLIHQSHLLFVLVHADHNSTRIHIHKRKFMQSKIDFVTAGWGIKINVAKT